ncbi:MAG: S9 family peptidase [Burkholderiaceae bacterium]|jgi:dipeptidyl aminopeptidase/acylaminoacyl peptidase|nr:S9 family peptidase [Burkholderiaceae bacterium]
MSAVRSFSLVAAIAALAAAADLAVAEPALPTVEDFFRPPAYAQIELSPNGSALATLAPINDRANLVVIDLATRKPTVLTSFKDEEVDWLDWVNDRRLLFDVIRKRQSDGQRRSQPGLHAIDKDGGRVRWLAGFRLLTPVSRVVGGDADSDVVLGAQYADGIYSVWRINTVDDRAVRMVDRAPGANPRWLVDRKGAVRAAVTGDDRTFTRTAWLRRDAEAPWQKLAEWHQFETTDWRASLKLETFDYDGALIVSAVNAQGRRSVYLWDEPNNRLGLELASHPQLDVHGADLIFDPRKRKLVGARIGGGRAEYHWIDDDWARWHAGLLRALPGMDVRLVRAASSDLMLVHAASDREPGVYYLFDPGSRKLEELVRERPWIDPRQMGTREAITYRARDGRLIPAVLTLPPGRVPKNLPLVVLVHGGPYVHGASTFWHAEAQFLASRGYVVLQPAYRGTLGYGHAHEQAGWRQWGLAMQDDLNDGVKHLAERGIADERRACVMGASYGGYAALMGVARDPGFWRCAISYAGVTDLIEMSTATYSDSAGWRGRDDWMRKHVGDPETERDRLRALSPLYLADRIREPVLLAVGGEDRRVPLEGAVRMRDALRQHGVAHEWVMYDMEIHGFSTDRHRYDYYARVERFLAQHLAR